MTRQMVRIMCLVFLFTLSVLMSPDSDANAGLVFNGGFETGMNGWTTANQLGSEGTFTLQTGISSPVLGDPVPAPFGTRAAMSDAQGPGSHVLYQDIVIPNNVEPSGVSFSLFIGNRATEFATANPATVGLDFTSASNQQARVDIIRTTANPFSVAAADVLQNLFQTNPGNPLVSGYRSFFVDARAVLQANAGQTVRLRFAEVDNLGPFQLGVDNVDIVAVPELSSGLLVGAGGLLLVLVRRIRSRLPHS